MSEEIEVRWQGGNSESFEAARRLLEDTAGLLDNIMASMGDGLSIQDREMRIVYQNRFMVDHFGPHIGEHCYTIYEKRDTACEGCPIREAFRTGRVTKALRVGVTRDGAPFRFENIASVLRDERGEIVAGIELCRIVEDRERALDELRETTRRLEQTREQLVRSEKLAGIGQLAAGVAHEINNPAGFVLSNLNALNTYVDEFFAYVGALERVVFSGRSGEEGAQLTSIREGVRQVLESDDYAYLKNDLPEVVAESLKGMQRIKGIVSSLMAFAATDGEGFAPVDLNAEIESALLLLESEIVAKGRVKKALGDLPEISANASQLGQMLVNMLLNATQAVAPGGTIWIASVAEGEWVRLDIADDGEGIAPEVLPNIFNPFFTTREVGQGAGLGLSIAYRVVENHRGHIDVQSKPGRGSRFIVRLPVSGAGDMAG